MRITFNEALALVKAIRPTLEHGHADLRTRESLAAAKLADALAVISDCKAYVGQAPSEEEPYQGHYGIPDGVEPEEDDVQIAKDEKINIQDHFSPDAFGD